MRVDRDFLRDYFRLIFVVAGIAYLFFYGGTKFNLIDLTSLLRTAIVLLAIWLLLVFAGKTKRTALDLPLAIFIVILLVTSLTGDLPRQAFVETGYLLIAFLLFYFVVGLIHRGWDIRIFSKALLIIGGVFMLLGWLEFLQWYVKWLALKTGGLIPPYDYRLPAPNFICAVLNVWVLFAAGHFFYTKEKPMKIILGLYILSALGLIYLTSSRGGWLGLAGGIFLFGLMFLKKRYPGWFKKSLGYLKRPAYLIGFIIIVAAVLALAVFVLVKISNQPTHGPIMSSRTFLWNPAITAIKESPWIGNGPYAYILYYLRENSIPNNHLFDYAHNIYLDTLASSGIIGLIALIGILIVIYKVLFKFLSEKDSYLFYLGLGVFGGLSAFLIHGLFDSVHHTVPVSLWILCIILAIPLGYQSMQNTKTSYVPYGIGILLFPAMAWYLYSGSVYEKGINLAINGNLDAAISQMQAAEKFDPGLPLIPQQTAMMFAQKASETGQMLDLENAKEFFIKSIEMEDSWAASDLNVAAISNQLGELKEAQIYYSRAIELAPDSALNYWNLGLFYEANGELAQASEAYEQCLAFDNRMIFAGEWKSSDFRLEFSQNWRDAHQNIVEEMENCLNQSSCVSLALIYPKQATENTYALHYLSLAAAKIDNGQLEEAEQLLAESQVVYVNFSESNVVYLWLQAEINAAQGNYENAAIYGERALQAVIRPGLFGPGSYAEQIFGPVVYRRHELPDYFVPQVKPLPISADWTQRMPILAEWYGKIGDTDMQQFWQNEPAVVGSIDS